MNTFDKFLYTQAVENLHAGVYKLRLRNESGVFECIANVAIDNPENKLKKLEELRKKEEEEKIQCNELVTKIQNQIDICNEQITLKIKISKM